MEYFSGVNKQIDIRRVIPSCDDDQSGRKDTKVIQKVELISCAPRYDAIETVLIQEIKPCINYC